MADATPLLEVDDIETCYGLSQVLFGISLSITVRRDGGPDGPQRHGQDHDHPLHHGPDAGARRHDPVRRRARFASLPSFRIAQLGIGLVPEGRQIFPNLTVRENLVAASGNRLGSPDPWTLEKIHALFPRLAERGSNMGSHAVGRRAADAGDRPRADDQSAAADSGRGHRRPGAADPRRNLELPVDAQGARASRCW